MAERQRVDRRVAEPVVAAMEHALEVAGIDRYHWGGSWRRGSPTVGDLDLVLVGAPADQVRLLEDGVHFFASAAGPRICRGVVELLWADLIGQFPVDVWSVQPEELGPFMWFVTGPMELNLAMRATALRRGMRLGQYDLIDSRSGRRLDDGTEEGVARSLRWPWMTPEERDSWSRTVRRPIQTRRVPASDGGEYELFQVDGQWHCPCKGFSFRGRCKHIEQEEIQG